ncbi:hypothetical protein [Microcoleus sp.]|uniref:hypothetical protein n=1 Tax=Microcoleus sp. TaxID=44472 RepID=UPI003525FCEC
MTTILIANIGTSDIAVEIDGHYIPIGFNRNEINATFKEDPTPEEKRIWEDEAFRNKLILTKLCPELNVTVTPINGRDTFSFRELTLKLKEAYEDPADNWHKRISPGRFWGVLKTATDQPFNVREAHIFVTNQKPPHFADTIYLFDLLELWCKREFPSLTIKKEEINFSAIDQDALLQHYYHFFNGNSLPQLTQTDDMILVSNKGGTTQMKEALKIQAMASKISQQLFIEPDLCKTRVVRGQLSECNLTSYWQYMRTQKYQTADLLLKTRWDFDGAVKILQEWKNYLKFVTRYKASPQKILIPSIITINQVIKALSVAVDCFNLDIPSAKEKLKVNSKTLKAYPHMESFTNWNSQISQNTESQLLNLYTRCRIYWQLGQVANFLASMSSFYEEVLYRVLQIYNGEEFFENNHPGKWYLSREKVVQKRGQQKWNEFLPRCNLWNGHFQLKDRPNKRIFLEELVNYRQQQVQDWQKLCEVLKSLDYWVKKRNDMIHGASGISIQRMYELWEQEHFNQNPEPPRPDKIVEEMADICRSPLSILKQDYQQYMGGDDYYIYSQIRQWAIAQLMEDAKR